MILSKRLCTLFLAGLFYMTTAHTSEIIDPPFTNIPDDLSAPLTAYMLKTCPQIPCGKDNDGYFLRHATPADYEAAGPELRKNQEIGATINDMLFYNMNSNDCLGNCLVALLETNTLWHPNIYRPEALNDPINYLERAYAFFKKGDEGKQDTLLGFIHSAPGLEKSSVKEQTQLSYYILKDYRKEGYSMPMISGFVDYLKTICGQKLPQITLPDMDICEKIVQTLINFDNDNANFEIDIPVKHTVFTTIQGSVPLRTIPSFISLNRVLPLREVHQIWESDSKNLAYLVPKEEERQTLNTLLVFSTDGEKDNTLTPVTENLRNVLKNYRDNKLERLTLFTNLQKAAFDHPVSHTMFLTTDPTDNN